MTQRKSQRKSAQVNASQRKSQRKKTLPMKRLVIESLTFKEEAEEKLRRVLARVGLFDCLECWVAEDALPSGREQKWLNVVWRKR